MRIEATGAGRSGVDSTRHRLRGARRTHDDRMPFGQVITVTLPVVLRSESNRREHWAVRMRRRQQQQLAVRLGLLLAFGRERPPWRPRVVRLVRLAPRMLDSDNLAASCKYLQDAVAAWLGVDDGPSGGIEWLYAQEREPSGPCARVEFYLPVRPCGRL